MMLTLYIAVFIDRCGALLARGSGLVDCHASWLLASYEPWVFEMASMVKSGNGETGSI